MSRSIRLVLCFALVLIAPAVVAATVAEAGCDAGVMSTAGDLVDPMTGLPTTVLTASGGLSCPAAFETASWCSQCWDALNQCSGPNCYFCTEVCLARLGCWIP